MNPNKQFSWKTYDIISKEVFEKLFVYKNTNKKDKNPLNFIYFFNNKIDNVTHL